MAAYAAVSRFQYTMVMGDFNRAGVLDLLAPPVLPISLSCGIVIAMDESDRTLSEQAETICNTDILRFDPHALNLIDWTKKPVIHGSIQQSSEGHGLQDRPGVIVFTSTPDSPALLIESEADFCTILFTIDHRGTAVLLHSPFAPPSDIPDEMISFSEYSDTEMVEFRDTVADTIDARQSMTVVTGMSGTTAC